METVLASPAIDRSPAALESAEQLTARMEKLAASGEWSKITQLAERLQHALLAVPDAERNAAMLAAKRCLARVQTAALATRNDVSAKLSQLRRGQQATKAYVNAESSGAGAVLR